MWWHVCLSACNSVLSTADTNSLSRLTTSPMVPAVVSSRSGVDCFMHFAISTLLHASVLCVLRFQYWFCLFLPFAIGVLGISNNNDWFGLLNQRWIKTPVCSFTGKNLSVLKEAKELNTSTSQDFTIPCHITKQSSNESEFQVTWFWQKETGNKQSPIFTAYRNSTLEDKSGNAVQLRFSHALPNQFSLMVIKPNPEHRGLYYCEVEEWLQSLSHGWRKVAVETSGNLTVHVYAEGKHLNLDVIAEGIEMCVCGHR